MSKLYSDRGNLVVGFHGCSREIANRLVNNPADIKISEHNYDWLGLGFYIWENNLERAKDWATVRYGKNAAVVGVVYELGTCLDLMDSGCIALIKEARKEFERDMKKAGLELPVNRDRRGDANHDKIFRDFDCAVINYLTRSTEDVYKEDIHNKGYSDMKPFDSVRGCFWEGAKIDNMEIHEKTHIQVAIRNMNCIKGIFLPREEIVFPAVVIEE